jgi:transcriptional regulator with XRE-family HTH domain
VSKKENRAYFKALGAHIAQLRKEHGMTQAELAGALGVSQQTVFASELGDRPVTVPMLAKLAKAFTISVEELMGIAKPRANKKRQRSPKLMRQVDRMQKLTKTQQRFVVKIIDIFIDQNNR